MSTSGERPGESEKAKMLNVSFLHEMPYSVLPTVWEKSADSHIVSNKSLPNEDSEIGEMLLLEYRANHRQYSPCYCFFSVSLWTLHAQLQAAAILKKRNRLFCFVFSFKLKLSGEKC